MLQWGLTCMYIYTAKEFLFCWYACSLDRVGAFCCPNVWNLWIIPSIEVCYSDLQGLFFTKYYFFGSDSLKRPMWESITVTVLLGFFLTFLSISLNFKLGTYLFDRHFTWLIILFSKLTKNIFYFNKFFLSKFESNLTGSTFS